MIRRSSPLRRSRLRRQGARALRELEAVRAFRTEVLARAEGRCQRCRSSAPLEAHHLLPRSRGGAHEASNGAALCGGPHGCHRAVHDATAPDWREWIRKAKPRGTDDAE